MGLTLSALLFVGTHFLLSHPLRDALLRRLGPGAFQGVYSLIALVTFGLMIWYYDAIGREPQLWAVGDGLWLAASLLMWFGSILFVGSFLSNPALPGARLDRRQAPRGVFAITRHAMMWGFASWALVHPAVVAPPQAIVCDGALLI